MWEVAVGLLQTAVDIVVRNAEVKRDSAAPLRLYELYISLTKMIDNAYNIKKELQDSKIEDRHIPHIARATQSQARELRTFSNVLFGISFYTDIYDCKTSQALDEALGNKYVTLQSFNEYFLHFDDGWLTVRRARAGKRDLNKILKELPRRPFFRPGHHNKAFDLEDTLFDLVEFDLTDVSSLDYLIAAVDDDIAHFEKTAEKLAGFIKEHCALSDFFHHTSGRRR